MSSEQKAGQPASAGLRELASTELTALTRELCGPYDEWRTTVLSFRKALAGLERLCEAASKALPEDDSKANAAAAAIVARLAAAAETHTDAMVARTREDAEILAQLTREESELLLHRTREDAEALVQKTRAEAEALAQKTRAEAEADSLRARAEAEAVAERARTEAKAVDEANRKLQGELQTERDRAKSLDRDLQDAKQGRTKAEAALEDAHAAQQKSVAALEKQLQTARAELESERAEVMQLKKNIEAEKVARGKLLEALQTVQRAVSLDAPNPAAASDESAPAPAAAKSKAAHAEAVAEPAVNRPLKLIKTGASAELERELTEYVKQLFEQIQSIYTSDLKSTDDSAMVVDRLTANLRHAHSVFSRRLESTNAGESRVFEEQLALLLDAQSQTSFGRHLAIAAYNYSPDQESPSGSVRGKAS